MGRSMRVLWATDIHLDCAGPEARKKFYNKVKGAEALIISGDIGNGVKKWFDELSSSLRNTMVYFVLGNHDYYGRGFDEMDGIVKCLCKKKRNLIWLSGLKDKYTTINDIPILGHEGWYDCYYGRTGNVILNDFLSVKDIRLGYLTGVEQVMIDIFREKAEKSARHFEDALNAAFAKHDRAVLVTHVPPFVEAAWHRGRLCESIWQPFMTSKISGDVLIDVMQKNPDKQLLVLCGHTHSCGEAQILPNLRVWTAESAYRFPDIYKDLGDLNV